MPSSDWYAASKQVSVCVRASISVMQNISDRWMCGGHMKNDSAKARWAS